MASNKIRLNALNKDCVMTVNVIVTSQFKIRMAIALLFIRLGWRIAGGRIEVKQ